MIRKILISLQHLMRKVTPIGIDFLKPSGTGNPASDHSTKAEKG